MPPTGHKGPNPKRTKVHLRKFHSELPGNSPLGLGVPDVPAPKLRAPGNGRPGAGVDEAPGHLVRRWRRIKFSEMRIANMFYLFFFIFYFLKKKKKKHKEASGSGQSFAMLRQANTLEVTQTATQLPSQPGVAG